MNLESKIREVMDFPKKGIGFKDITTLLLDSEALRMSVEKMGEPFLNKGITKIIGIESRGFIFGMPIAYYMNLPFIPIRKPGKLPSEIESMEYELEYGTDKIEIHKDSLIAEDKVLIVDDLLATGGTMEAAVKLVEKCGAEVAGISFLIELNFLNGRNKLNGQNISSLVCYD